MKILYKFPSRSRPEKFFNTINNIINMAMLKDYIIIASLDIDDISMNNFEVIERCKQFFQLEIKWGKSQNKIDAINRDIPKDGWEIVVVISDDMEIVQPGFDVAIVNDVLDNFPNLDCAIHYEDGFPHDPILSVPIYTKKYYDRFGYIYHPSYQSLFADEEAYLVAKKLGKLYSSASKLFKHNHPAWIGGEIDNQLKHTQSLWPIDRNIFLKRKQNNFFVKL